MDVIFVVFRIKRHGIFVLFRLGRVYIGVDRIFGATHEWRSVIHVMRYPLLEKAWTHL